MELKFDFTVTISEEDVNDILCTALEGGINYWAVKAIPEPEYKDEIPSVAFSKGSNLKIVSDEGDVYTMTQEGFKNSIERYAKEYDSSILPITPDGVHLDTCNIDAEAADIIIQLAIFNEIVYG